MATSELEDMLKCPFCKTRFKQPIILPCGESICKQDIVNLYCKFGYMSVRFIKCCFCNDLHQEPESSFPFDRKLIKLLELNIDTLDLGQTHKVATIECEKLKNKIEQLSTLTKNGEIFLNDHFLKIRNKIELRQVEIKNNIDKLYEKIFSDLSCFQKECLNAIKYKNTSNEEQIIEGYVVKLKKLTSCLSTLKIDENKWKAVRVEAEKLESEIDMKLEEMKNSYLLNKVCLFEAKDLQVNPSLYGTLTIFYNQIVSFQISFFLIR